MDHSKPKSKLICVCNQAVALSFCQECPKGKSLRPDSTYYWSTWERRVGEFVEKGNG